MTTNDDPTTPATRDDALVAVADGFDRTPWEPPGLTFKVGDRVRIRLSAECRATFRYRPGEGHPTFLDGLTGWIIDVYANHPARGHHYGVVFDERVTVGEYDQGGEWLSGAELQPAASDDEREGR
jgi:hypothetical protein